MNETGGMPFPDVGATDPARRRFLALGLAGLAAGVAPMPLFAQGAPRLHVVELFTSQGCSSCPPADELLFSIARQADVIALSLPVDYWDYIGWKDTFGRPEHTQRQKAYSRARGDGKVYTPQAVINGLRHCVGSDAKEIEKAAQYSAKAGAMSVPMRVEAAGDGIILDIGAASPGAPTAGHLTLFRVSSQKEVRIGRGENSGRQIKYANVARTFEILGEWRGAAQRLVVTKGQLASPDTDGWIVLLQAGDQKKPGVILAAAKSAGI
ncbi:MAG: DUF1223 domain-containing protein [Alphaproteobacteria bacterium]|nr:DUF1223 domain-containing protein [Alphaproteobacteria bacterium]